MSEEYGRVHVRTAQDRKKAFGQYDELRRTGRVKCATIIAELHNGAFQILGNQLTPDTMAQHLLVAAKGLEKVAERKSERRLEPVQVEMEGPRERSGDLPLMKTVTREADGQMRPKLGEEWLGCGECPNTRFFVTTEDLNGALRRLVCSGCGNEISLFAEESPR